jgi:hypothetical protein
MWREHGPIAERAAPHPSQTIRKGEVARTESGSDRAGGGRTHDKINTLIAAYSVHPEDALLAIQSSGFDMKKLSIIVAHGTRDPSSARAPSARRAGEGTPP